MNTQMERPRGHTTHEDDPHHNAGSHLGGGHDDTEHHEKKSVLKKVKAKAKKIKNTITGHSGHGHEHDHDHHDHDGYEDEDEEMDTDPEVHGTHTTQSYMPGGQQGGARHHDTNIVATHLPVNTPETVDVASAGYIPGTRLPISAPVGATGAAGAYQTFDPTATSYVPGHEETLGHSRTDTGRPIVSEGQAFASTNMPVTTHSGVSRGAGLTGGFGKGEHDTSRLVGSEQQPYAPISRPVDVHDGGTHGTRALGTGKLGTQAGGTHDTGAFGTGQVGTRREIETEEKHYVSKNMPTNVHDSGTHDIGALGTGQLGTHVGRTHDSSAFGTGQLGAGRAVGSEEKPYAPKNTPVNVHDSATHGVGAHSAGQQGTHVGGTHGVGALSTGQQGTHAGGTHGVGALSTEQQGTHVGGTHGVGALGTGQQGTHVGGIHGADAFDKEELGARRLERSEEHRFGDKDLPVEARSGGTHGAGVLGSRQQGTTGVIGDILKRPTDLEKDPHAPKDEWETRDPGNYQTKVSDPTGMGTEAKGVTPILHQLDKMKIHDESDRHLKQERNAGQEETLFKPSSGHGMTSSTDERLSTGSHDQFSPEPITPETSTFLQEPEFESFNAHDQTQDRESYTDEMSPLTTKRTTIAVISIPGSGTSDEHSSRVASEQHAQHDAQQSTGSYGGKLSSVTTAIADKAAQAKDVVAGKLGYGGTQEEDFDQGYGGTQEQHAQHDTQQSTGSYGGKLSSVTTAIADKAAQAKDVVAAKLGYGGTQEEEFDDQGYGGTQEEEFDEQATSGGTTSVTDRAAQAKDVMAAKLGYGGTQGGESEQHAAGVGSIGEYGKKVATTVQEKLAPVYDRVAGVGSAVASKVQGSGTEHEREVGATNMPDKGVSVKEYLAEKLKPGEDDKALSEVITEALPLHKQQKDESTEAGEEGKKVPIRGRVTESEEVRRRLGGFEETSEENVGSGPASPGRAVIDRIKDAATSWFGKGGETQPLSRGFMDNSVGKETQEEVKHPGIQ